MKITVIVDRIEDGVAMLQFPDGMTAPWPAEKLPQGTREGDCLNVSLERSSGIKKSRREQIKKLRRDASHK
ncbi:MAG: DUF3006 domain-containing protein [Candidatus Aureabacteria bacterium]|nr:DUF3006 domain-containing protein [Candidatus Auribacterota bacterium]